jgi:hypothetical protein
MAGNQQENIPTLLGSIRLVGHVKPDLPIKS